jgi:hypothetical protein
VVLAPYNRTVGHFGFPVPLFWLRSKVPGTVLRVSYRYELSVWVSGTVDGSARYRIACVVQVRVIGVGLRYRRFVSG